MKKMRFLLILILILFSLPLHAEEIQLKDGTKVTGKLVAVNGDTFQIKTAYGQIEVPRSDVLSITFPENQPKKEGGESTGAEMPVDESIQGAIYINRTEHFQIGLPKGWENAPEMRKGETSIKAALKSADQTLFFFFTPEKFDGALNTYKLLAESQYQTTFKDYQKFSESEVQLDGKTGIKLVWQGRNPQAGNALVKFIVYILPYNGRMIRLSFGTLEPIFNDALPTFETMAASYRTISP